MRLSSAIDAASAGTYKALSFSYRGDRTMARWLVALTPLIFTGCFNGLLLKPTHCGGPIEETVITDAHGCLCRDKVVIIDVEGMILNARTSGLFSDGENPVSLFRERLEAAADDRHVKAVVLRINSP